MRVVRFFPRTSKYAVCSSTTSHSRCAVTSVMGFLRRKGTTDSDARLTHWCKEVSAVTLLRDQKSDGDH